MNYKPLPYFVVPCWFWLVNWFMDRWEDFEGSRDWITHGYTNPWFILVDKEDKKLIAHEQEHGFQMKRDGWFYFHKKYAEDLKNPKIGYWNMKYEVDARRAENNV